MIEALAFSCYWGAGSLYTYVLACLVIVLLFCLALEVRQLGESVDFHGTTGVSREGPLPWRRVGEVLSPVLVGAAMTAVFLGVLWSTRFYEVDGPGQPRPLLILLDFLSRPDADGIVADGAAHVMWCVSVVAVIIAAIAVIWVTSGVWLDSSSEMQQPVLGVTAAAGLAILGYLIWLHFWGPHPMAPLGGVTSGAMLCESLVRTKRFYVGAVTDLLSAVAAFLSLMLAGASALTLRPTRRSETWQEKSVGAPDPVAMRDLAGAWRVLDRLLYVGSALLVAGLLEVMAVHSAAYAPFPGISEVKTRSDICKAPLGPKISLEKTRLCDGLEGQAQNAPIVDDLKWMVKSVTITFGAAFSLLLASLYVPSALVLQRRVRDLTSAVVSEKARLEVLTTYGLQGDLSLRLVNTVATVGPLATGLIPVVLGLLKV